MKHAACCQYLVLLIVLAAVLAGCQMVAPTAPDEVLASKTAAPATDVSAPLEVASTNTDIEANSPELEPSVSPSELTFETPAGLWEIGCVSYEVNANGTYRCSEKESWSPPAPQFGGRGQALPNHYLTI